MRAAQVVAGVEAGSAPHVGAACAISLAGMSGSLVGGYVSDRCFRSERGPVVLGYAAMQLVCLGVFALVPADAALGLQVAMCGL